MAMQAYDSGDYGAAMDLFLMARESNDALSQTWVGCFHEHVAQEWKPVLRSPDM